MKIQQIVKKLENEIKGECKKDVINAYETRIVCQNTLSDVIIQNNNLYLEREVLKKYLNCFLKT